MVVSHLPGLWGAVLVISRIPSIIAQGTTTVQCTANLWTVNERGQSPCFLAARLRQICTGGNTNLPPLINSTLGYAGAQSATEANGCSCSSVTYSLLAACALCQNGGFFSWQTWSKNCTDRFIGRFPAPIPPDLSVPFWAYENVTILGTFNTQAAQAEAESHLNSDVTGTVTPSATLPTESTNADDSTQSKANVGAIAGGVVGGIVGVLAIILLTIIIFRRRKSHEQLPNDHTHVIKPFEVTKHIPPPTFTQPMTSVMPLKLYDPADPSTFPPELDFNPTHFASNSTTSASLTSPTTTNAFSPTSGTGPDVGYVHNRQFSGGTTVSSSSTTNVILPGTVLSPTIHGRNISAESGTSSHNASMGLGLMYNPRVQRKESSEHVVNSSQRSPGAQYHGAPEL